MANSENLTRAQERFNEIHEFLMAIMLFEEKLKKECIKDELTGVYLIPTNKLDAYIMDLKRKSIPLTKLPRTKWYQVNQKILDKITNEF